MILARLLCSPCLPVLSLRPGAAHGTAWPAALVVSLLLTGCASLAPPTASAPPAAARVHPPSPTDPTTAAAAPAAAATAARPEPGAPRPFADVIRGASVSQGFLPVWRKDEKVWIEIAQDRWNQPFLLTINVASSVGQRGLYASQMGRSWMAQFRRIGNQVQLVARNTAFRADGDTALQIALTEGLSDSLLGATPVASAPHPERQSVLIDAAFLLGDIAGYSSSIESAFRMSYGFDRNNSYFESPTVTPELTSLRARTHFATGRIPTVPASPNATMPSPPTAIPDARSFFVGFVYNFLQLPPQPMVPRRADPRIGHFTQSFTDFTAQPRLNPRVHYVNRWRLEKREPLAARSEPVTPIVFWLDRNIPARYREAVRAGVLEWNKAFERIGFVNAIEVRQQPDDAEWDTMDARHASVRWFVGADSGSARGPHHADPRTGEILDADIAMSDVFARGARRFIVEDVGLDSHQRLAQLTAAWRDPQAAYCDYAVEAANEMHAALDLLEARGEFEPDSPRTEAFVQAVIKDTVMHEVGHTLGLKHNFKGSTAVTRAQLADRAYTEANGISGSVMDYNGYNVALRGEPQGAYNNTTLGPYDYWAIEYAYKPIDPADEARELERIASRSTEPRLAYGDDYDAGGFAGFEGVDPTANRFDLGDDPLAYFEKRLKLSQELWQRVQAREPRPGDEPVRARRAMLSGFAALRTATDLAAKHVGGMVQVRDLPGTSERRTYTPVDAQRQRQAVNLLTTHLFSADNFRFRPEFLRNLPPDYLDRSTLGPVSLPAAVLGLQTTALDRLLSPGTASRVLDLPNYVSVPQRQGLLSLDEIYGGVQDAIWSELRRPGANGRAIEVPTLRRNLQREHLRRVVAVLTRPSALPADAQSLVRLHAARLRDTLQRAVAASGSRVETQAHLRDSLAMLTEALRATYTRG